MNKMYKVVFRNLAETAIATRLVATVLRLAIVVFVGAQRFEDYAEWAACRKYISFDLKGAVSELDPTRLTYIETFSFVDSKLAEITRADVVSQGQPLISCLYDWLVVCVAMSKRAIKARTTNPAGGDPTTIGSILVDPAAADPAAADPAAADVAELATAPATSEAEATTGATAADAAAPAEGVNDASSDAVQDGVDAKEVAPTPAADSKATPEESTDSTSAETSTT